MVANHSAEGSDCGTIKQGRKRSAQGHNPAWASLGERHPRSHCNRHQL